MGVKEQKTAYGIKNQQAGNDILQAGGNIIQAGGDVILPPALPVTAGSEMDNAKNEIEKIKKMAFSAIYSYEKIQVIDVLATYQELAIMAIAEIGNDARSSSEVRCHVYDTIRKINEKRR